MKSSSFARSLELAKLVAQVGLKEMKSSDFKSRLDQAKLIAQSLSSLKGAAMKAGQLLSLDLDNYFPPEAIEILSQLQNAAYAQPFDKIEKIIRSEISANQRSQIQSISTTPIGVASIGQVHRARYLEQDIVLKVQYEEVSSSIDSDLKILKTLATTFCQLTGRKMNLDPLFLEFKNLLEQELNYESEAKFQKLFHDKIERLNHTSICQYKVPTLIPELSSKKILAMSFESGQTLKNWITSRPTASEKLKIATAILDLYFHEFFEWGLVQTDPNLGNFLIHKEGGELRICLLDFGATRTYSRDFIKNYISLLDAAANKRSQDLRTLGIEFGMMDPRESEAAFLAFEQVLQVAIKPFFAGQSNHSATFDFSDQNHLLESQSTVKTLTQHLVYSPPPYSIVFLHRKLAGVYAILKNLGVKMDISPYWQMMKDLSERNS